MFQLLVNCMTNSVNYLATINDNSLAGLKFNESVKESIFVGRSLMAFRIANARSIFIE